MDTQTTSAGCDDMEHDNNAVKGTLMLTGGSGDTAVPIRKHIEEIKGSTDAVDMETIKKASLSTVGKDQMETDSCGSRDRDSARRAEDQRLHAASHNSSPSHLTTRSPPEGSTGAQASGMASFDRQAATEMGSSHWSDSSGNLLQSAAVDADSTFPEVPLASSYDERGSDRVSFYIVEPESDEEDHLPDLPCNLVEGMTDYSRSYISQSDQEKITENICGSKTSLEIPGETTLRKLVPSYDRLSSLDTDGDYWEDTDDDQFPELSNYHIDSVEELSEDGIDTLAESSNSCVTAIGVVGPSAAVDEEHDLSCASIDTFAIKSSGTLRGDQSLVSGFRAVQNKDMEGCQTKCGDSFCNVEIEDISQCPKQNAAKKYEVVSKGQSMVTSVEANTTDDGVQECSLTADKEYDISSAMKQASVFVLTAEENQIIADSGAKEQSGAMATEESCSQVSGSGEVPPAKNSPAVQAWLNQPEPEDVWDMDTLKKIYNIALHIGDEQEAKCNPVMNSGLSEMASGNYKLDINCLKDIYAIAMDAGKKGVNKESVEDTDDNEFDDYDTEMVKNMYSKVKELHRQSNLKPQYSLESDGSHGDAACFAPTKDEGNIKVMENILSISDVMAQEKSTQSRADVQMDLIAISGGATGYSSAGVTDIKGMMTLEGDTWRRDSGMDIVNDIARNLGHLQGSQECTATETNPSLHQLSASKVDVAEGGGIASTLEDSQTTATNLNITEDAGECGTTMGAADEAILEKFKSLHPMMGLLQGMEAPSGEEDACPFQALIGLTLHTGRDGDNPTDEVQDMDQVSDLAADSLERPQSPNTTCKRYENLANKLAVCPQEDKIVNHNQDIKASIGVIGEENATMEDHTEEVMTTEDKDILDKFKGQHPLMGFFMGLGAPIPGVSGEGSVASSVNHQKEEQMTGDSEGNSNNSNGSSDDQDPAKQNVPEPQPITEQDTIEDQPISEQDTCEDQDPARQNVPEAQPITEQDTNEDQPIFEQDTRENQDPARQNVPEAQPITEQDTIEDQPISEQDTCEDQDPARQNVPEAQPITEQDTIEDQPISEQDTHEDKPITEKDALKDHPLTDHDTLEAQPITDIIPATDEAPLEYESTSEDEGSTTEESPSVDAGMFNSMDIQALMGMFHGFSGPDGSTNTEDCPFHAMLGLNNKGAPKPAEVTELDKEDSKEVEDEIEDTEDEDDKKLPPVRNSLDKKKKKKKEKPKPEDGEATNKRTKKISGYDFRAWDKFDVDKACEEVDEGKAATSGSEYETDEEWEEQRKKQQAMMCKDEGNQYFKEKKYDEAIECYTSGMTCDPSNALLYANRAMALLKQEKYGAAEVDCTRAIALDPTYVKAYSRRATARMSLNKLQLALEDFSKVLKLEPENKQAAAEVKKIAKLVKPPAEAKGIEVEEGSGIVKPIYKPPSQRSKKPLRRIPIEEIGDDKEEKQRKAVQEIQSTQSQAKQKMMSQDEVLFKKITEAPVAKAGDNEMKLNIEDITGDEELTTEASETVAPQSRVPDPHSVPVSGSSSSTPTSSPRVPSVPPTSFQFQTDWKCLKNHPEQFYQYFKAINPSDYVKLFGQALDSDILMMVLKTLRDFYLPSNTDVFQTLSCLTDVKRFSMTAMFMSNSDKEVVQALFSHLRSDKQHSEGDIAAVEKKYQL